MIIGVGTTLGCSSVRIKSNALQLRQHMLDYHEAQILDNVIRTYNNVPIVHFDVEDIEASVSSELTGGINGGQTLTNGPIISQALRPFELGLAPKATDSLDLAMKPVMARDDVYEKYESFVATEGSVVCSLDPPSDHECVHVLKKWRDGRYYWVPKSFAKAYFELFLVTSVKRQPVTKVIKNSSGETKIMIEQPANDGNEAVEALEDVARELKLQRLR